MADAERGEGRGVALLELSQVGLADDLLATDAEHGLGLVANQGPIILVAEVRAERGDRLEEPIQHHRARAAVVADAAEDRVRYAAERRDLRDHAWVAVIVVPVARR